jgi:hypothetical protein
VEQSFNCEGRFFQKGTYVTIRDPLVEAIWQEYPYVFKSAAVLAPPD